MPIKCYETLTNAHKYLETLGNTDKHRQNANNKTPIKHLLLLVVNHVKLYLTTFDNLAQQAEEAAANKKYERSVR